MNENSKAFNLGICTSIRLLLTVLLLMPYYEICGNSFPVANSLELSENLFWFLQCCIIVAVVYFIGCIGSNIIVYGIYYVQRVYCMCKLRRPERVYPPKNN